VFAVKTKLQQSRQTFQVVLIVRPTLSLMVRTDWTKPQAFPSSYQVEVLAFYFTFEKLNLQTLTSMLIEWDEVNTKEPTTPTHSAF
jgi:hypothetical protein